MPRRADDSSPWIAYADFATTLSLLFLILAISAIAGRRTGAARLGGVVNALTGDNGIDDCLVVATPSINDASVNQEVHQVRTEHKGQFYLAFDNLDSPVGIFLRVTCAGIGSNDTAVTLQPADSIHVVVKLTADSSLAIQRLQGDALFRSNSFQLLPEGIEQVQAVGMRLKERVGQDQYVLVTGHTDDRPFYVDGRDNFSLSGERAAAAAQVLVSERYGVGIPACRVAIMGFGPSRPVTRLSEGDSPDAKAVKRKANRRIEFSLVRDKNGVKCP